MIENLSIRQAYSSSKDNLVQDFYNPILQYASRYDRITGYFSPKVLALAAQGFASMINNDGKIRLITSVQVDPETYSALSRLNHAIDSPEVIGSSFDFNLSSLQTQLETDYFNVFRYLLNNGTIEMKIAVTEDGSGILHEKIGIIEDIEGKALSFSGSNNETVYGWTKNIEQFKVFPNWEISTANFYQLDRTKFDEYWNNQEPSVVLLSISDAFKNNVLKANQLDEDIGNIVNRIKKNELESAASLDPDNKPAPRSLFDYQIEAIQHWRDNNYMSIFEMATGTGKTFTTINALKQFKEEKGSLHALVVVPLVTLVEQWKDELADNIEGISLITASSTNPGWREEVSHIKMSRMLGNEVDYVIISTYSSFGTDAFSELMDSIPDDDLVLVADEMHNIVTDNCLKATNRSQYKYRLGLSATPTRLWKPAESDVSRRLFGDNSYVYSLEKALENKFLVPYNYFPTPIYLTVEEYEEYEALSKEIGKMSQYQQSDDVSKSYSMKLTKRAKIKKQAENKLVALNKLIKEKYPQGLFDTLVYADSGSSLEKVQQLLTDNHIKSTRFTGNESLEQRLNTISNLRDHLINAIVAIKCLDEGVDIPSAVNGFFLSNNTDQREYVQRLGRVLRKDKAGNKEYANIYDFIVFPPVGVSHEDKVARNLVKNELIRAYYFVKLAQNELDARESVGKLLDDYGYYFTENELSYNQQGQGDNI